MLHFTSKLTRQLYCSESDVRSTLCPAKVFLEMRAKKLGKSPKCLLWLSVTYNYFARVLHRFT